MLSVMAGSDQGDLFSVPSIPLDSPLGDYRIAYCPNLDILPVTSEISRVVEKTVAIPQVDNQENGQTFGPSEINGEKVDPILGWSMACLQNFTGHPACSIPAGFTPDGLPVGMQITSRRFDDARLLAISKYFETLSPWFQHYTNIHQTH